MNYAKAIGGFIAGIISAGALGFSVGLSLFAGGESSKVSPIWLVVMVFVAAIGFQLVRGKDTSYKPGFIIGLCIGLLLVGICFMRGV